MIRNIVSTAALIGREVHTETPGLDGQLEEIMMDTENGVVLFAVVSFCARRRRFNCARGPRTLAVGTN
jgi:hypothetical protein